MITLNLQMLEDAELMANYILEAEEEDFKENPSDIHIYFIALRYLEGEEVSEQILRKTKEDVYNTKEG